MHRYFLVFVFAVTFSSLSHASEKALVIIDMQHSFVRANGEYTKRVNRQTLKQVLTNQIQMIRTAKAAGMPILLVEYIDMGETTAEISDELKNYPDVVKVIKRRDGLFDDDVIFDSVIDQLKSWRASELIVVGANGRHCVRCTILGALRWGFTVSAYSDGIADFNRRPFESPFRYPSIRDRKLNEFSDLRPLQCVAAFGVEHVIR